MAKTIIPSEKKKRKEISDGQISRIANSLETKLKKHRSEFESDAAQRASGDEVLSADLLEVVRKHINGFSHTITRCVSVNRNQSPQEVLDATGRKQFIDKDVIKTMTKGEGENTEVVFFRLRHIMRINDDDLEKEYELRGLKPADSYSLSAVNKLDPSFAKWYPNCTHWKDENGKWCYIVFRPWYSGEECVAVQRANENGWDNSFLFAGISKVSF